MARLIFDCQNSEKNNSDQTSTSSITVHDNKCSNFPSLTNDSSVDKLAAAAATTTRIQLMATARQKYIHSQLSCDPTDAESASAATTDSESLVARLASKLDTTVLVSINDANAASTISPEETPPLPLPASMSYPTENAITLRNSSSVQKTIKFFEKDVRTSSNKAYGVIKRTEEQHSDKDAILDVRGSHENGESRAQHCEHHRQPSGNNEPKLESNVKPRVQPKPIILLQKPTTATQKSVLPEHERNTEKIYHAPKLYAKSDRTQILKDKRLSIAKDFSLESVLNSEANSADKEPDDARKFPTFNYETKMANSSFLHKHQGQCIEHNKSVVAEHEELDRDPIWRKEQQMVASLSCKNSSNRYNNLRNSSSLHDSLIKTINETQHLRFLGDYEELNGEESVVISPGLDENANGHYYQYLDEGELSNVYADIIYAQLTNKDEVENYETISSESRPNSPTALKDDFVFRSDHLGCSDSESSLEQINSLYDSKPTCEFSSSRSPFFSLSNEYSHTKCEASRISITTSSGITNDEEDADYCDSDVNENHAFTMKKRNKLFKKRKPRFILHKKDPQPIITQQHESSIEDLCDDFDDSSSEFETYDLNEKNTTVHRPKKHPISSVTQSQNIYGLVEKARKTVRKSWSSLSQIKKMSVGNITAKTQDVSNSRSKSVSVGEIDYKNGHAMGSAGSVRWTSFKSKLKPKYSTITASTSIFYLPPEDLLFKKSSPSDNVTKKQNGSSKTNNNRRRTMCIELRPTRPTSPPPPPPMDRLKISENGLSTLSIYSDPSTKSSNSGSEVTSELNSSRSSDLHLRFSDEPLYQFYAESIAQLSTTDSLSAFTDSDGYEEITSTTSRPSAMELITPSRNGHGQHRSLWCEVPEVKNSGILDTLSPSKKKLQETIFEIITSEASYYKSLSVLDKIFVSNSLLRDETILSKTHWKILFGNVSAVKKCSEKLLASLEKCWQESILLAGLCDVIYSHATEHFRIYVKYCSNQIYISRTLKELRELNSRFTEIISQLEADPACQSLNLASFLMLPMQRITRMPLLLDAVVSKMDHILDSEEYKTYQISLATLNKIVRDCNDSACKLERYEEMLLLSQQLEFSKKDVKMYTIASSSRWLIRSGPMEHISPPDMKLTLTKKLTKHTTRLYFFLFNDIFIVTKKKSDAPTYVVFDYCPRNVVQMSLPDNNNCMNIPSSVATSHYRYLLLLTLLENHERKTVEMILNCDSDSTRQRWLEATSSHLSSANPDEKLYEEWDCPQVSAIHAYSAVQPDELSLHAGDVAKVLKKTTDGWFHGERIRDGMIGWFPGNYTVEIASQHTRAKNLKLRHRLLTLSASYLQNQQQKKT